jgi:type I restriction enzyme M protein
VAPLMAGISSNTPLGTLFYHFMSENFASYIEGGDDNIICAEMPGNVITPDIRDGAIKTKGYFILSSQMFVKAGAI